MNIKSTLVNEYTVGGSLLLVGFGFFSTRFADVLSYRLTTLPSMIPVIGGATVTVGRILGIVPATLGLAVLFRKAREVPLVSEVTELPIVKTIVNFTDDLSNDFGVPIKTSSWTPSIGKDNMGDLKPIDLSAEEFDAEQLLLCAEHDDYFSACGCGTTEIVEEKASETIVKKTTGSPKQQAWRSSVAEAKGDMAKAKQLYAAKGY